MWKRAVFSYAKLPRGAVDRDAYVVRVLEQLHRALSRRDVFASPSNRWADLRATGCWTGRGWEAMRADVLAGLSLTWPIRTMPGRPCRTPEMCAQSLQPARNDHRIGHSGRVGFSHPSGHRIHGFALPEYQGWVGDVPTCRAELRQCCAKSTHIGEDSMNRKRRLFTSAVIGSAALLLTGAAVGTASAADAPSSSSSGTTTGTVAAHFAVSEPDWSPGKTVTTDNGVELTFQSNGNIVLYSPSHQALWATGTDTGTPEYTGWFADWSAGKQALIIYGQEGTDRGPICNVGPEYSGATEAVLQDDGDLVFRNASGAVVWSSNTAGMKKGNLDYCGVTHTG